MYTTTNVRKFLNASNTLIHESNENVILKFSEMILEKFENIDKAELDQLAFTLKDEVTKDHLSNSLQKKKKRNAKKREPTLYNLFVKEQMFKLKTENPELKNKELMGKAAQLWNVHKEEKLKETLKETQKE